MGGGTGTGAAPVVARCAKEAGILTVGVVTKPFHFEGVRRMRVAEAGITELHKVVDTLLIIPNQNLFRVANEKTTFADAFAMADQVLYSGVACITDLMVKEGLINLDFADVRAVMREMGKAMMGTGEASGEKRALSAAEAAISNPLIDDASMKGASGLLISITGGKDLTLYEVDEAATRIREEVDQDANIIVGATFDENLDGIIRVSVVATGIEQAAMAQRPAAAAEARIAEVTQKLRADVRAERPERAERSEAPRPASIATPVANNSQRRGQLRGDRDGRQGGGRRRGPADDLDRGCDDPADAAEAFLVPGAASAACPTIRRRRAPSSRRRRSARLDGRGCPGSTNCRSRGKGNCAPSAAKHPRPRAPRSAGGACCGGLLPSVLAGARPRKRKGRPATSGRCARCRGRPTARRCRPRRPGPRWPSAGAAGTGAGLRICQAAAAPGARSARTPGACA